MKFSISNSLPPAWVFQELVIISFLISLSCHKFEWVKYSRNAYTAKRQILPWRQQRELPMLISAGYPWISRCLWTCWRQKFSLSTWHENPSPPFSSGTESIALLRDTELSRLRCGRKIQVHEKPSPFLLSHSDACTDQKLQQLTMRIIWCYKTLTLLLHYQMSNKTFYISFPCP